jgi:hypothetical protein
LSFSNYPFSLRAVSDSETNPFSSLLSSFALGPSWARATGSPADRSSKPDPKSGNPPPRRDDRRQDDRRQDDRRQDDRRQDDRKSDDRKSDDRRGGSRDRDGGRDRGRDGGRDGGNRSSQGRGRNFDDRREAPPRFEDAPPADGVRVTLIPDAQAVHLIGKEIHHVARVYALFDVAKILLAERARCRAVFEAPAPHAPLLRGKIDDSIFLTREEALRHLWQSELRNQFIEEETIEVDPPTGNFQSVARCGMSGEWLGPPNFHAYQINLRRLHRERFAHLPFAVYSAKVRTERGEEAVNAWLETTKQKNRWRIKGDADDAWLDDRAEAERALGTRCFDQAFAAVHTTEVLASIPPANLSPSLLTTLKIAGNHARNHPAILIPSVCRAVEAEHLPVFKRQGKLLTGPARPHPLPPGAVLAERPGIMVEWIRANKPAKLEGLWQAVLPEGSTAPPSEFAADLFWLLHQGHILLFTDDTLYVQEHRETPVPNAEPKAAKSKKKKSKKTAAPGDTPSSDATAAGDTPAVDAHSNEAPSNEATDAEALPAEVPSDDTGSNETTAAELATEDPPAPNEEPPAAEISLPTAAPAPVATEVEVVEPAAPEVPVVEASTTPAEPEAPQPTPPLTTDDELSKIPAPGVDVHPGL